MSNGLLALCLSVAALCPALLAADEISGELGWPQWRGPQRDGQVGGPQWPDRLSKETLEELWRIPLGPSYSGPIVSDDMVFTTATHNKETEVVYAFDRQTGKERWRTQWQGAMKVPFFAAANGSWMRSTPTYDGENVYVAGMRDVLVCLNGQSGAEQWRVDFVERFGTEMPSFGFVSSPLVDAEGVYVQAGASLFKLDKGTGEVVWRSMHDNGGMFGSAFSSPLSVELAGKRQLLVQTREELAGVDLQSGAVLWRQKVPSFRGMNILTPVVQGDTIFTSTYRNGSWLYRVSQDGGQFKVETLWSNNAKGYMSTPVVVDGHAYLHLQNGRFTCVNLQTGERSWTSSSFGKYASLVVQGDRILALDAAGGLLLIKAAPQAFELIDEVLVSDAETWAHLAVSGAQLYVRQLDALVAYRWGAAVKPLDETSLRPSVPAAQSVATAVVP